MTITTKKHKHPSPNNNETNQDIISNIPDTLLIKIISLLPPSDANRTRILSKRWKNLYAFLPNLHFIMPSFPSLQKLNTFHHFVHQTLSIRGDIVIEYLFLQCEWKCDYDRVYDMLCAFVVQCKVRKLVIKFPNERYKVRFCWDLFKTWNSLVELNLEGGFMLDVPEYELLFPCLKRLELVSVGYFKDCSVTNLVSGCPVLEELFVEREVYPDNLEMFKVSSVSLKRLWIAFPRFVRGDFLKVVIDAPKLKYIYVLDNMSNDYSFTKPLDLVEGNINHSAETIAQIIPFLSSAKILKLTCIGSSVLNHPHDLDMPMFPNLVRLVIDWGLDLILVLLNNMPNLEHITFLHQEEPLIVEGNLPEEPPLCLRFKMKEIILPSNRSLTQEEFTLIRYLLKHSSILETFRINAHKIDRERRQQLLNLHRSSECCCFEFTYDYCNFELI